MFGKENFMIIMNKMENKEVVDNITGVIDMLIKKHYGKTFWRMLDEDNPDLKVVVIRTTYKNFNCIREIIENSYPGVCKFKRV